MAVLKSEMMLEGEVASLLQGEEQQAQNNNNMNILHPFSSLGRQSSIYSLTLDEFQHELCDSGKNFGSMNMDEFLTSIWNAEENQAINSNFSNNQVNNILPDSDHHDLNNVLFGQVSNNGKAVVATNNKQPSLPRQGSLTLPAPLCRKTVDEVWSEIHREQLPAEIGGQSNGNNDNNSNNNNVKNIEITPRQPTFGEMTLVDFLVKAGVVREHSSAPPPLMPPQQQQFSVCQSNTPITNNPNAGFTRPIMTMGASTSAAAAACGSAYPSGSVIGETWGYANNGKRSNRNPKPTPIAPPPRVCYGGRMGNGGGYGPRQPMGVVAPVSPVSSDRMCTSQMDNAGNQYGMDMSGLRGRKRIIDGPVERVVERRQRRMIKNRESAARSRARKQAYTVELEAELNQLKEENVHLKGALAEIERKRRQQYFEELRTKVQTKAQKAREKLRIIRRNMSCPL